MALEEPLAITRVECDLESFSYLGDGALHPFLIEREGALVQRHARIALPVSVKLPSLVRVLGVPRLQVATQVIPDALYECRRVPVSLRLPAQRLVGPVMDCFNGRCLVLVRIIEHRRVDGTGIFECLVNRASELPCRVDGVRVEPVLAGEHLMPVIIGNEERYESVVCPVFSFPSFVDVFGAHSWYDFPWSGCLAYVFIISIGDSYVKACFW